LLANPVCQARTRSDVLTSSRAGALLQWTCRVQWTSGFQWTYGVHMISDGRQIRRSRLAGEPGVSGTYEVGCIDAFAGKRAPTMDLPRSMDLRLPMDLRRSYDLVDAKFEGAGLLANPVRHIKPDFLSRPC
jgi:hypothetical protein